MKDRVSQDELRNDLHGMQLMRDYRNAEDKATKYLNTGLFDPDDVLEALKSLDGENWGILRDMIQNDPCAAGIKLKQAVYEALVRQCLSDE